MNTPTMANRLIFLLWIYDLIRGEAIVHQACKEHIQNQGSLNMLTVNNCNHNAAFQSHHFRFINMISVESLGTTTWVDSHHFLLPEVYFLN